MRATMVGRACVCAVMAGCVAEGPTRLAGGGREAAGRVSAVEPLVIGESFTIDSAVMGETRRVNVMVPTVYGDKIEAPMPVLYMLDGGVGEDFLHVAGLVQVLVSNGGMRPFVLVGIENTQRRRDMTGPTSSAEDRKIAPMVGGSATFRRFIKEEVMPAVRARYRTTEEAAVVGESLAGLFVVETLVVEPRMFGLYIAIDPSVWWNDGGVLKAAEEWGAVEGAAERRSVFLASSNAEGVAPLTEKLGATLRARSGARLDVRTVVLPGESHATVYHPAAMMAFRALLGPAPASGK